jgi:hypothetical protein
MIVAENKPMHYNGNIARRDGGINQEAPMTIHDARDALIDHLGGLDGLSDVIPNSEFGLAIRDDKVDPITDAFMELLGDLIATIIDAGSEREAVEENDALRDHIRDELRGWSETGVDNA